MSNQSRGAFGVQNASSAWVSLADIPEHIEVVPVQMTGQDGAPTRGVLYRRRRTRPKVGVHLLHPRTDQSTNYNLLPLAEAGYAALGRASRWPNNDVATVHESLLLDMAAGVRFLKDSGCEKVVLLGNSGGSPLAAFYQEQAQARPGKRLTTTAADDPLDLNAYELIPADGIALIAPHVGQGLVLGKCIDAAVVSENNPLVTDPDLDIYDAANGFVTPPASSRYDAAFLTRYRDAQRARVHRLDLIARNHILRQREAAADVARLGAAATLTQRRAAQFEPHMIVYRTEADPAFVDLNIEPDDRTVRSYFGGRPDLDNFGADGFARYITPRAWLSTWSALSSRARTIENLSRQTAPLVVVHYAGDCGTRMSEARAMYDQAASADKELYIVQGADHYGFEILADGQRGARSKDGIARILDWLQRHFPVD